MSECPFCNAEAENVLRHIPDCEHAPVDAREEARDVVARRDAFAKMPSPCCKLRKKILISMHQMSKQDCGVDDSELADVMTFDRVKGKDVVTFRFCPWCGLPWMRTGIEVY